jgi:hypothetical protein
MMLLGFAGLGFAFRQSRRKPPNRDELGQLNVAALSSDRVLPQS